MMINWNLGTWIQRLKFWIVCTNSFYFQSYRSNFSRYLKGWISGIKTYVSKQLFCYFSSHFYLFLLHLKCPSKMQLVFFHVTIKTCRVIYITYPFLSQSRYIQSHIGLSWSFYVGRLIQSIKGDIFKST